VAVAENPINRSIWLVIEIDHVPSIEMQFLCDLVDITKVSFPVTLSISQLLNININRTLLPLQEN
jgi:hypothetical protein